MKSIASLFLMSSITLLVSPLTFAQPAVERVTLMLNGSSCESSRPSIEAAIKELPGVWRVDGHSVPDHLLIDVEKGRMTVDELSRKLVEFPVAKSSCQVSAMQSCITADMAPHAPAESLSP